MRISAPLNPTCFIPLIYVSLSFPMMVLTRDHLTGEQSGSVDFKFAFTIYLLLILVTWRKVLLGALSPLPLQSGDTFFILFVITTLFQALTLQNPMIIANLALLLGLALSLRCASKQEGFVRALLTSSLVLLAFLLTARIAFGPPEGRWLGGIHPNHLAGAALVATILAMFSNRRVFDIVAAVSLGLAIIVSSRYAIVTIAFTYGCFWLINIRHAGRVRIFILFAVATTLILDGFLSGENGIVSQLLAVNDAARGLGSGISGRDSHWAQFLPQLAEKPLLGFGFRDRDAYNGAHNGFLNLILENGILGGGLFILFFVSRLRQAFRRMTVAPKTELRGNWLVAYLALIIGVMLQPQLINFGEVFGVTALILMFSSMRGFGPAKESAYGPRLHHPIDLPRWVRNTI